MNRIKPGWFYILDGKQEGPLSEEDLKHTFESGALPLSTPVWRDSLPSWLPAGTRPEFQEPESISQEGRGHKVDSVNLRALDRSQTASGLTWILGGIAVVLASIFIGKASLGRRENEKLDNSHHNGTTTDGGQSPQIQPFESGMSAKAAKIVWRTWEDRESLDRAMLRLGFEEESNLGLPKKTWEEIRLLRRSYLRKSPRVMVGVTFAANGLSASEVTVYARADPRMFRDALLVLKRDLIDVGSNLDRLVSIAASNHAIASSGTGRNPDVDNSEADPTYRALSHYVSEERVNLPGAKVRIWVDRMDIPTAGTLASTPEGTGGSIAVQIQKEGL